jgi:hypothetical protein
MEIGKTRKFYNEKKENEILQKIVLLLLLSKIYTAPCVTD